MSLEGIVAKAWNWTKKNSIYHAINTTIIVAASNPIFAMSEVFALDMPQSVHGHSRAYMTALNYAGLAFLYSKGRDYFRRIRGITQTTKEITQFLHDIYYATLFNSAITPAIYLLSGERSGTKIGIGTLICAGLSVAVGVSAPYLMDVGNDLIGYQECNRASYPRKIKEQPPYVKKMILAGFLAASTAAQILIYSMADK